MAQNSSFFLAIIEAWDEMALDASALSVLIKCEGRVDNLLFKRSGYGMRSD